MITHVVAFRWTPDLPAGQVERIAAGLDALPAQVPSIRSYRHGADLAVASGPVANFDYAIVATFDDVDGWREYDVHPAHHEVRTELIRPWIAERAAVQFPTPAG